MEKLELVDIKEIKPWKKNRNKHSEAQIEKLCEIIRYQGWRNPLLVDRKTKEIIAGNGRYAAAKKMGLKKVPVIFQDYENEEQRYAHMVSDNSISAWAELDLENIKLDLRDLPELDIDKLGLKSWGAVEEKDIRNTSGELDLDNFKEFQHECPKCGFGFNDV